MYWRVPAARALVLDWACEDGESRQTHNPKLALAAIILGIGRWQFNDRAVSQGLFVERHQVVALSVAAGSRVEPEWLAEEKVRADPTMLAALSGAMKASRTPGDGTRPHSIASKKV